MLNISKVIVSNSTFGNVMYLVSCRKYMDFNNKDNQLGWKYEVLVPALGMEKITVKILSMEQPISDEILSAIVDGELVKVEFVNLESKLYMNNSNFPQLTSTADSIRIKLSKKNKDSIVNEV